MRTEKYGPRRGPSRLGWSLRLLTVAVCLWPALTAAQTWNPTASDGAGNTAAGSGALTNVNTGGHNTAIGYSSLHTNTSGTGNTASGEGALTENTSGGYNTSTGYLALRYNTAGAE